MKVSAVCPSCGRATASKGRSECLYCGMPLDPVETGKVTAPSSGVPIGPPGEKAPHAGALPASPTPAPAAVTPSASPDVGGEAPSSPPAPPQRATVSHAPHVPMLYKDRAERMQAETINPVTEFLKTGTGKFVIWLGAILVAIGGIVLFINSQAPKVDLTVPPPPLAGSVPAGGKSPEAKLRELQAQATAAAAANDASAALRRVAEAIERIGAKKGHYPEFVPSSLVGLDPAYDFASELALFAERRVAYRLSIDAANSSENFTLRAVSAATGEVLTQSGTLRVDEGRSDERTRDDSGIGTVAP